ncbi:hypothetical protein L596_029081 [Steinernema carpocapsae]|uniref:Uncharacterized protein n=1 Tax=Steinernema carpocapsae TaxID=34508 RepID=A0A4U5LTK1_STECR|nr:hypothetical protein L596_029081 [Steinernema carpocapsae]
MRVPPFPNHVNQSSLSHAKQAAQTVNNSAPSLSKISNESADLQADAAKLDKVTLRNWICKTTGVFRM